MPKDASYTLPHVATHAHVVPPPHSYTLPHVATHAHEVPPPIFFTRCHACPLPCCCRTMWSVLPRLAALLPGAAKYGLSSCFQRCAGMTSLLPNTYSQAGSGREVQGGWRRGGEKGVGHI